MNCPLSTRISAFSALVLFLTVVFLLLMDSCGGQSQVIGPLQPVVATVGDDIILPCHLEPSIDAATTAFEWTRPDLDPRFVYVWRSGEILLDLQNPSYKGRTSLSIKKLKSGDISLKLSEVKPSDEGKYRCYIPGWEKESFVELVVGAMSTSSVVVIDRVSDGLILQCKSKGWYPEPEVLWLDGEGNLLPAGPTETVRGPDDLYTVSSRVTVEKRHSNSFTCRVQQKNINQSREVVIRVSDEILLVQSSSAAVTGLAVSLSLCILLSFAAVFVVWKKTKMGREGSKRDEEEKKNKTTSNDPEHQPLMEGGINMKEAVKEETSMNRDKGGQEDTFTLSSDKGVITPVIPLDNLQKETSEKRVQSEGKPPAESQQRQEAKKRNNDQSTLIFAYGHLTRS